MWIVFGMIAIVFTTLNLYFFFTKKDYTLAMVLGLSFTILTLNAEYSVMSKWVIDEDWAALMDVVPSFANILWVLSVLSIVLNALPVLLEIKNK